jgi:hypothetical protein
LKFERPAAFLWCSRPSSSWSSTSAKSLGLTIPSKVVAIADEVIEYLIRHLKVGIASRYMLRGTRVSLQSERCGSFSTDLRSLRDVRFPLIATKLLHYSK